MLIEHAELIIGLIFGVLGFIISFFVSRSLNIIIFGGLTYAIFKALDAMGFIPDWKLFNNFIVLFSDLGRATLTLVAGMLDNANIFL